MRTLLAIALVLLLGMLAFFFVERSGMLTPGHGKAVDEIIARNVAARGGAEAWRDVSALRLTGRMDLGHDMHVPYVLEQKRPDKMRLEFVFDGETAIQSIDGGEGWKLLPFRGRTKPEPMTDAELREMADNADPYGLLFESAARGYKVELEGREPVDGREAIKLKVTLPHGSVRRVYLDAETALEIMVEARRTVGGRERRVETYYYEWQDTDGLLIPRRQQTRTEGDDESHFLTVETVRVNPPLDDSRFAMPAMRDEAGAAGRT